jgi:hypothetical protein
MMVIIKFTVFWDVTLGSLVDMYQTTHYCTPEDHNVNNLLTVINQLTAT